MTVAVPANPIREPFGNSAASPYINLPIPKAPPGGIGVANFDQGFPPATMTPPTSGGVPPSGADMNGILFMVSAYAAMLQLGGLCQWDATQGAAGYSVNALLAKASGLGFWLNTAAANTTDPDTGGAGWLSILSAPLYNTSTPTSGTHADNVLPGISDYFLDIVTSAGAITLNGFVAQRDGQRIVLSNAGANPLTIGASAGTAANQVRMSSAITLLTNDSITIQYCAAVSRWIQV